MRRTREPRVAEPRPGTAILSPSPSTSWTKITRSDWRCAGLRPIQRLRASLGAAGQRYWEREHSMPRMVEDYERVMVEAAALPAPRSRCQPTWSTTDERVLNRVLADFGLEGGVWGRV